MTTPDAMPHHDAHRRPVLAALLLLAVSSACFLYPRPASGGAAIYRRERCADCHGERGAGTPSGPALTGLGEHWSLEELKDYLADPESYLTSEPRLAELSRLFGTHMVPFDHLSEVQRRELAQYLLLEPGTGR